MQKIYHVAGVKIAFGKNRANSFSRLLPLRAMTGADYFIIGSRKFASGKLVQAEKNFALSIKAINKEIAGASPADSCLVGAMMTRGAANSFLGDLAGEISKISGQETATTLTMILAYTRRIQRDPANTDALHNLGNLFFKLKKYPDALRAYDLAIGILESQPKTPERDKMLTAICLKKGDVNIEIEHFIDAIKYFNKAMEYNNGEQGQSLIYALFMRGMAKEMKNDLIGAALDFAASENVGK
jgi:tetratricopeptide (TPR) repeat protein